MQNRNPKIVALAGGVGGARLADGLAQILNPGCLTVIVNIGDDFEHYGLFISPDLDTVCYTLAGIGNPETGWGLIDESFHMMESLRQLGVPDWFNLGDRDMATHLVRTQRLKNGESLSQVTSDFCKAWGVSTRVLPASDDRIPTIVLTDKGSLSFQEYFVHLHCEPKVRGFYFKNANKAWPAPGVLESLEDADGVIICPSNPWVSIDPILSVPGVRDALARRLAQGIFVVAVSPIIGGKAVKGPAAKMFVELGLNATSLEVARHYQGLLSGFVLDKVDGHLAQDVKQVCGGEVLVTDTLMRDRGARRGVADKILDFITKIEVDRG